MPGTTRKENAYRAEMYGGLAMRRAASLMAKRWGIKDGYTLLGSDDQGVITQLTPTNTKVSQKWKNADLIREARLERALS